MNGHAARITAAIAVLTGPVNPHRSAGRPQRLGETCEDPADRAPGRRQSAPRAPT